MNISSQVASAIKHFKKVDPILASIITDEDQYKAYRRRSAFESLVRIIVGQQLSIIAAQTIFDRLKETMNGDNFNADAVLKLNVNKFYKAGVSKAKTKTIKQIASEVKSNRLNFRRIAKLNDEEVAEELTSIKGIGPWTAKVFLMFVLQRKDIFPATDGGIVNAMSLLYGKGKKEADLIKISENWKPHRTIACWFLWRFLDRSRKKS